MSESGTVCACLWLRDTLKKICQACLLFLFFWSLQALKAAADFSLLLCRQTPSVVTEPFTQTLIFSRVAVAQINARNISLILKNKH